MPESLDHELARQMMVRCALLGTLSEEPGRLTRRSFTPAMRQANDMVGGWMRAAGMSVRVDTMGNLIGRYSADQPAAQALMIGSHLDTVRDAGRYDGPLGVLVGLAVVERLAAAGRRLPFAIEVVAFTDEEGLRFHTSFLGSRTIAGSLDPATLALVDADGLSVAEAIRGFGGDPAGLPGDARRPDELLAYLEVHIEQGPLLEQQGLPVGVVTAITGIERCNLRFSGSAGHAGTTPMHMRRDALCAAAEFILAAETHARTVPGLVATVGQIEALPGASNVIPGAAHLSLDLRHQDDALRQAHLAQLHKRAYTIAAERRIGLEWTNIQTHPAVPMAAGLRRQLATAIELSGYAVLELPSGAGHDAAVLAGLTEAAMLFVRCAGGVSHNPAEAVDQADVAVAIEVVARFVEAVER